jgi:hypothetical protein
MWDVGVARGPCVPLGACMAWSFDLRYPPCYVTSLTDRRDSSLSHGERVADLTTLAAARVVREARSWEGRREACMRDMASTRSHPM